MPQAPNTRWLTPAFLSNALATEVTNIVSRPVGNPGKHAETNTTRPPIGYVADVYELTLKGPAAPQRLILKCAAQDTVRAELAQRFDSYVKEYDFYQHRAALIQTLVPHCYARQETPFQLLLEHLGPVGPGTTNDAATLTQCQQTLAGLAMIHRTFARDSQKSATARRTGFTEAFLAAAGDMQSMGLAAVDEMQNHLTLHPDACHYDESALALMRAYARRAAPLLPIYQTLPVVFSHMDTRNDNLVYDAQRVRFLDWGESCFAPLGFDPAYYLVTSISVADRRAAEFDLIQHYHSMLDLTVDIKTLKLGYQLSIPPSFYLAALMINQGNLDQGRRLGNRCLAAISDHHADIAAGLGLDPAR